MPILYPPPYSITEYKVIGVSNSNDLNMLNSLLQQKWEIESSVAQHGEPIGLNNPYVFYTLKKVTIKK